METRETPLADPVPKEEDALGERNSIMTDEEKSVRIGAKWKALLGIVFLGLIVLLALQFNAQTRFTEALEWIQDLGAAGPLIFILFYVLACVLFVPGSFLTLGAGVIFGVIWGAIYVSIASTLGATCAFLLGRFLARTWVEKKLEGFPKFKAIDEAVAKEGWKIVGLTRLSLIFPFNLLNYAYGITKVSLRDYFLASWIGMFPGTVMYVYIGSLIGDLARMGTGDSPAALKWILYVLAFFATAGVTAYVTRIARRALKAKVDTT